MQKTNKIIRLSILFTITTSLIFAVFFLSNSKTNHNLVINYQEPSNQQEKDSLSLIKKDNINELITETINDLFIIPEPLFLNYGNSDGPEYDAEKHQILMPYSFIQEIKLRFVDDHYSESGISTDDATMDVVMHTVLHELAHALIDMYELPIIVREEDAADALATLLLIEFFEDGQEIAITAADLFDLESEDNKSFKESDFWDEHSLDIQRYYNTLCAIYGSDSKKYAKQAKDAGFSNEKLEQCIDDYQQLYFSWMKLLKPHLKGSQAQKF